LPLVSNIKFHDHAFELSTAKGRWQWTTRLDVSQSNPLYSVRDIISPYGLLRDSVPIPGDVVEAMQESIAELKSNFAPAILLGPPTSLSYTVDEGRGFTPAEGVTLTNNGVYGSLLGCSLTASTSWIRVTPANIGNLAMNETGEFSVEVNSTNLLASGSPYAGAITIQDPAATNTPVVMPITVTVRPKATIDTDTSVLTFAVVRPLLGPFPSVADLSFDVSNVGPAGSVLDFEIQKLRGTSDWLTAFLPSDGSLTSGQSSAVVVSVEPPSTMLPGTYLETLRVSGYSSNSYVDVQIQLVVT